MFQMQIHTPTLMPWSMFLEILLSPPRNLLKGQCRILSQTTSMFSAHMMNLLPIYCPIIDDFTTSLWGQAWSCRYGLDYPDVGLWIVPLATLGPRSLQFTTLLPSTILALFILDPLSLHSEDTVSHWYSIIIACCQLCSKLAWEPVARRKLANKRLQLDHEIYAQDFVLLKLYALFRAEALIWRVIYCHVSMLFGYSISPSVYSGCSILRQDFQLRSHIINSVALPIIILFYIIYNTVHASTSNWHAAFECHLLGHSGRWIILGVRQIWRGGVHIALKLISFRNWYAPSDIFFFLRIYGRAALYPLYGQVVLQVSPLLARLEILGICGVKFPRHSR